MVKMLQKRFVLGDVTNSVSVVASKKIVREKMVPLQRKIAQNNNVIMDGRDIGTNVLKDATFKFFLTASVEKRLKEEIFRDKSKR